MRHHASALRRSCESRRNVIACTGRGCLGVVSGLSRGCLAAGTLLHFSFSPGAALRSGWEPLTERLGRVSGQNVSEKEGVSPLTEQGTTRYH